MTAATGPAFFIAERTVSARSIQMRRCIFTVCAVIGLGLVQHNAFAWGSAGHMVIAAEGFRQLSPELKAQVIEVLKGHPEFADWKKAYHPNPNLNLATYIFMRASNWPDEIRNSDDIYDHPNWHFVDYPIRPPAFAFEPDASPTNNVLYGVAQAEQALSDTNANPELRGAMLSYLVHLVGDMHQPLHCESLFNDTYPKGDRGGNDIYVNPTTAAQNRQQGVRLHGLWDGLLGSTADTQTQWKYAVKLDARFPRKALPELTQHTTPVDWSLESRELAIKVGYLDGKLQGSTSADAAPRLPENYTKTAKAVAERQAALAGYRLADEIEHYLKVSQPAVLAAEYTNLAPASAVKHVIGTAEAANFYDETMTVTGKVVSVSVRPTITIISLDKPAPGSGFTAVIFDANTALFGDLSKLTNQNVELNGSISEYHKRPEMILESPSQIKVLPVK